MAIILANYCQFWKRKIATRLRVERLSAGRAARARARRGQETGRDADSDKAFHEIARGALALDDACDRRWGDADLGGKLFFADAVIGQPSAKSGFAFNLREVEHEFHDPIMAKN